MACGFPASESLRSSAIVACVLSGVLMSASSTVLSSVHRLTPSGSSLGGGTPAANAVVATAMDKAAAARIVFIILPPRAIINSWRASEVLRVFGVQPLPALPLHEVGPGGAADRLVREECGEHVEADVPARGAHRDEPLVDVVPEREARAVVAGGLELPAHVRAAPAVFEDPGCIGARDAGFRDVGAGRAEGREFHRGAGRAEIAVRVERRPLAKLLWFGERFPDLRGRVAQLTGDDEGPLVAVLLHFGARGGARLVSIACVHRFLPFGESRCRSRASRCFVQSLRKGASHSSSSNKGSGLNR